MIETIKVSSRGQIVIPENVRKNHHIEEGTKLILIEQDSRLILEKEKDFIKKIQGMEDAGWLSLAEKNLAELWDNKKDEEWKKYL
jgi:AbrB family looped-hinge helix DNA binding protein